MSGKNGSGKGTVSKLLADKLGYEYISIGNMKRELATAMDMTISEFNKEGEKPENREKFDLKYEEYQKKLDVNSNIILDSRLWFYCQPDAFKVYLDVSDEEAARRIFNDKDRKGDAYVSLQAVQEATNQRNIDDAKRYKELYGIDIRDMKNFDLVVNTDGKTPQNVADEIIRVFTQIKK
jgi:CMP/dCMP kinase